MDHVHSFLVPQNQEAAINHRVITSDACVLSSLSLPCPFLIQLHTLSFPSSLSSAPFPPSLARSFPYSLAFSPPLYFILALGCSPPHTHFPSLVYTIAQKYTDTCVFSHGLRFNTRIGMPISENIEIFALPRKLGTFC